MWSSIIPVLEDRYQINCVAPPWVPRNLLGTSIRDLDNYIEKLAATITTSNYVLAWSLGGLVAIKLATNFPALVSKIIFIASTTQFVNSKSAIDPVWFKQFQLDFKCQPKIVFNKFLALQAKGDEFAKHTLRQLRDVSAIEDYDLGECEFGLAMLEDLDLSGELAHMACDAAFIHGESDAVLPIAAGRTAANLCNAQFHAIPSAGHAPHVSHPQQVSSVIMDSFR